MNPESVLCHLGVEARGTRLEPGSMLSGVMNTGPQARGLAFLGEAAQASLNRVRKMVCFLLPVFVLALAALPATAQDIGDGFYLIAPDGSVIPLLELAEVDEQPGVYYYVPVIGLADPAQFGNATALLNFPQEISDIFGVVLLADGNYYLAFGSDVPPDDAYFPYQPSIFMDESPDGRHDATMYLDPNVQALGYTLLFFSDPADMLPQRPSLGDRDSGSRR